ncbi:MAG: hypothetical protein L3J47_00525 [Sulfurovum sp.]|nr:hypothetical protein [Sulfurovum sp.]
MIGGVSLSHYNQQPVNGFGTGSTGEVGDLQKALNAGYDVSAQTGGGALRVESLESSLKIVTHTAHHIKFWKKIPKSPAYSTVEEYNQLSSYGNEAFAFMSEGKTPQAQDSSYARKTSKVKFIGVTREVSHVMSVVHPAHGDVIALENQNGILWMLSNIEKSLFTGDSSLAFNGESVQWDGLDSMIDPSSFLDLEGYSLSEADIEEAANLLVEAHAYPTDLWLGTRVASDLTKTFYPRERISLPAPQNGVVGLNISAISTQAGIIEMNPNVFLKKLPTPPAAQTSGNAPVSVASVASAVAGTDGDFAKGAVAGTNEYGYAITACNEFGESAPVFIAANRVVTAANKVTGIHVVLTITNNAAVGAFLPEYYRIYRTSPLASGAAVSGAPGDFSLIGQIPTSSQANGGVTVFNDLNFLLPFTEIAYMGEMTESVLTFRQLLPMLKMDLAVLAPSYRWMILLYGTPVLFADRKWVRLINIGVLK